MKKWIIKNRCTNYKDLAEIVGTNPVVCKVATNRGMTEPSLLRTYLNPTLDTMHEPALLWNMEEAIALCNRFIGLGEKISLVGDYDVDGVMSTTILYKGIKEFTNNIETFIPDRAVDGYGINVDIVEALFISGTKLIITCDNGVSAFEAIEKAKVLGMWVIVLDHHGFKTTINSQGEDEVEYVKADVIVNPHNPQCNYPFKSICAAMVCYKFIELLFKTNQKIFSHEDLIIYAAIATVCDVVDLVDENRFAVKEGLRILNEGKPLGIDLLCKAAGIGNKPLSTYDIGYILGPCLNASGRLEHANLSLELMLTDSSERAESLAKTIVELNQERRQLTDEGIELATELIPSLNQGAIKVLHLKTVHESIAGIIAGRMKEKLYTPFIVLTDAHEGMLKGSARSVEGINITEEIGECGDLLKSYGGHAMAAGLRLLPDNLDIFTKSINKKLMDFVPTKEIMVDTLLDFSDINLELNRFLEQLEPFGKANEKPSFAQTNVKVEEYRLIGKNNNFLKLRLRDKTGVAIDGLYFGEERDALLNLIVEKKKNIDVVFAISANEYMGKTTMQIVIQEFRENL